MTELSFRKYQASAVEAMFQLDEVCFSSHFRFSRAQLKHYAEKKNACVSMAYRGDALAGFSIVHVESASHQGYVVTLDVEPSFRRAGLAAELMRIGEEQARLQGCSEMLLHVFTGNAGAVAFYDRIGYERLGRTEYFYGRDEQGHSVDAWLYRRVLLPESVLRAARGER
jgi:ribosomal-protein-alanine N-acetyltransferase